MRDGSLILLDARSRTEAYTFWNGEYDRDEIDFFKVCLTFGNCVFDVGANVGLIAIPLARLLQANGDGTLVAFEPVRANYDRLVHSVRANKLGNTLVPVNVALGDVEGEVEFACEKRGHASTGNAMQSIIVKNKAGYAMSKATITTLDSFVKQNEIDEVSFIKVDIEGAEVMFLRGAETFLNKCRPILYGEFNSRLMLAYGHTILDVAELIKTWNYRVFAFSDRLDLTEITHPKAGIGNLVLAPAEKSKELLIRTEAARKGSGRSASPIADFDSSLAARKKPV